uniref:Neurotransmitter-gated ion-channel transmembrane domain-containing protein n=1 Tax=Strigamia maritima TaxID=126957 RepID=T1IZK8_STRMM
MNLRYFPMDSQTCKLEIESFGYTARDIVYRWQKRQRPLGISPDVELSQFKLLGHRTIASEIYLSTGNYSRLACEFFFVRDMGYYLIQLYIPSGLIVIISWVSFWLNRNASPARVSLGVTTVLTMTTLMSSTNAALPKVSYVKSIDIYLGTCFVLVFAALLEYAAVGYLAKHLAQSRGMYYGLYPRQTEEAADPYGQIRPNLRHTSEGSISEELQDQMFPNDYPISPSDIDKYSRIAFPVFFVCFNLVYWIIYLHISNDRLSDDIIPLAPE